MAYLKSLLNPDQVLELNFEHMSLEELKDHLKELVLGEKDAIDKDSYLFKSLEKHQSQFREKRIKVSKHYLKLGGKLNPVMLTDKLPSSKNWVGIQSLIKE